MRNYDITGANERYQIPNFQFNRSLTWRSQ